MNNLLGKVSLNKSNNKKKIENILSIIIILVVTIVIMNFILKGNKEEKSNYNDNKEIILAEEDENTKIELEERLEKILSTIKGVGKVSVFINYSESSSIEPLYDETTTTSNTEEGDDSGGTRNVTETESKKDVVFSENSGNKTPVTKKTVMPVVKGAIITAEGAKDISVKTNIINAVEAVTGLGIDKVQVFEMNG